MPSVRLVGAARRDLKQLPRDIIEWVLGLIDKLEKDPFIGERLRLPTSLRNLYCFKLRRGDYRLVYCYVPARDTVYIVAVGHRDTIYEKFQRRLVG